MDKIILNMYIQTYLAYVAAQMKKVQFWLAVIFCAALSLIVYQEVLGRLWVFESLRVKIASWAFIVLITPTYSCLSQFVLQPKFTLFSKSQKTGLILLSILAPFVLAIASLDEKFLDKTIYFLLPNHSIQVEVPDVYSQENKEITLTGFYTQAQGTISLNALEIRGWKRKGDYLILTDPDNNLIKWQGKPGNRFFLVFKPPSTSSKIKISWDGIETSYDLPSNKVNNIQVSRKFNVPLYAGWLPIAIAAYLSTGLAIFFISVLLVAFPGFAGAAFPQKKEWIIYALPMYGIWSFYLLVFWPGSMSVDSINQWGQIISGKFIQAHPVAHTLTMWLITRLWFSPAAVALFQILVLGGILGWGIATLRESGVPKWLAWLVAIVLAISPANSILSITLWKDVLFSAVVVALTIIFLKITTSHGDWLDQRLSWFGLGLTLSLVSLYRLNGLFVSLLSILLAGCMYRKYWKLILKSGVLFLSIYFLFNGLIFRILNVEVVDMARGELVIAHLLAGHMKSGTPIVLENKELLQPALAEYPWPYICYRNSALFFQSDQNTNYLRGHSSEILNLALNTDYLRGHSSEILNLAMKATLQNPIQTLKHFACQGASVYRIPEDYSDTYSKEQVFKIRENKFGLKQSPILDELFTPLSRLLNKTTANNIIWFVWRMPFWMYLSVFGCIVFCIRNKDWKPFLILMPGLLTVLPYLILTLGQIFRYVYSMYLIGILLSGYFLVGSFTKQSK
jgi:hypothetical protein